MALVVSSVARGDEITEAVTRINDANCELVERLEESEDEYYACRGYGNITVTKLIGHDLIALSYGPDARNACAWDQGFISPSGPRDEITWLTVKGEAFATIERWLVEKYNSARNDYDATDWFAVTQIRPQQVCRIGYVRTDQPIALDTARALADRYSATPFDCNTMNAASFRQWTTTRTLKVCGSAAIADPTVVPAEAAMENLSLPGLFRQSIVTLTQPTEYRHSGSPEQVRG